MRRVHESDPARIIIAAIEQHPAAEPAALAEAILDALGGAGYDLRPIPIRPNPVVPAASEPEPYHATEDELRAIEEGLAGPAVPAESVRNLLP